MVRRLRPVRHGRATPRPWARCPSRQCLCGTPTVAYRRTGLTTAVIDGVSGHARGSRRSRGPSDSAVAALIEDPARRQALGGWGSLALASRNSPAAAVLGLLNALSSRGMLQIGLSGRLTFASTLRDTLRGCRALPSAGASGMVANRSLGRLKQLARTSKRRLFGRTTPYWLRWSVYVDAARRITTARRHRRIFGRKARSHDADHRPHASRPCRHGRRTDRHRTLRSGPFRTGRPQRRSHPRIPGRDGAETAVLVPRQRRGRSARHGALPRLSAVAPVVPARDAAASPTSTTRSRSRGPKDMNWKGRFYTAPTFRWALRTLDQFFVNSLTTGADLRRFLPPRRPDRPVPRRGPQRVRAFAARRPRSTASGGPRPLRLVALGHDRTTQEPCGLHRRRGRR